MTGMHPALMACASRWSHLRHESHFPIIFCLLRWERIELGCG